MQSENTFPPRALRFLALAEVEKTYSGDCNWKYKMKRTIQKVRTLKFGDFKTPLPSYAFKQKNDVIKTIDVRFYSDPLPPPEWSPDDI